MKKIFFIFLILILSLVFIAAYNNNPRIIISRISSRLVYKRDIRWNSLNYRIYLLGILPIGEADLTQKIEEYKGQKVYHLSAAAKSLSIFSRFFSGYAVLDSYVDMQKFNPLFFKQKLSVEGRPGVEKEAIYDQKQGVMSIAGTKRQILPDTQDALSAVFNIRRMDFDNTNAFQMNINTNQKNYILAAAAQPRELTVNNKKYKIVFLKSGISRRDKNPYHKSNITMILLKNEKDNLPVLIKVFASGILINARLTDIK